MDQDSIAPKNLIHAYSKYINDTALGMLCPLINDINCGIEQNSISNNKVDEVRLCIASATALRLEAWKNVGGFHEKYFIDSVDFDMCMLLIEAGYKILRVNDVVLLHEVGHSSMVNFLGKKRQLLNHSSLRYYYMYRNTFLLGKRHHCFWRFLKTNFLRFILINIFESNKLEKDVMILKGLFHGLVGRYGKY